MSHRQQLSQLLDGHDLSGYPDDVVEFYLDKLLSTQASIKSAGEHRAFVKSQGVYDSDYYDSKDSYDGRLEDLWDLQSAARAWPKDGLARWKDEFEERKKR